MALEADALPLGSPCPDFSLPATTGSTVRRDDFADVPVLGVFFTCNHCPYAKAVEDRLVTLEKEYRDRGFRFVAISPNDAVAYPEDSFENMRDRAQLKGYGFPYLYDEAQSVARAFGAVCTPDLFVYDKDRRLAYHGRLDDSPRDPARVKNHELVLAIDALLAGERPSARQFPSVGCSIKWKKDG